MNFIRGFYMINVYLSVFLLDQTNFYSVLN